MWTCPRCGVKLVTRNGSHACGDYSIEAFVRGKDDHARALFDRFVELVAACGPYDVAPAKTRVAFLAQVRFASVNRIGNGSIDIYLPRGIRDRRIRASKRSAPSTSTTFA